MVGDLFDLVHRANTKNVALLRDRAAGADVNARPADWLVVAGAVLLVLAALVLPALLVVKLVAALSCGADWPQRFVTTIRLLAP